MVFGRPTHPLVVTGPPAGPAISGISSFSKSPQNPQREVFRVTLDHAFEEVIRACAVVPREAQSGTWITNEMLKAYVDLHGLGYAHSVESWFGEKLGRRTLRCFISGKCFFGESMFHLKTDASKVALATLVEKLKSWDFHFIDSQMTTEHMLRLGAKELPRRIFLKRLQSALRYPTKRGGGGLVPFPDPTFFEAAWAMSPTAVGNGTLP